MNWDEDVVGSMSSGGSVWVRLPVLNAQAMDDETMELYRSCATAICQA